MLPIGKLLIGKLLIGKLKIMEKLSPFVFGNIVNLQSFTNREEDLKKLKKNLVSGINTIIISPRRWGKSSLVEKAIQEINIENPSYKTVKIDLFSVNGEKEFLEVFAREILKSTSSKWEDWVNEAKEIFKNIIPKISIGIQPDSDFSISFDWKEAEKQSLEILDLPETLAKKHDVKFIICIDEFQNMAYYPEFQNFEKKMRSVWQKHKNVVYCLYGSKRHMMRDIFSNTSKPFYKFGDLMFLPKIKKEKWVDFIKESFKKTNRKISDEFAEKIPDLMKNHSWYVQQFSYYIWSETKTEVTRKIFEDAFQTLVNSNFPLFQQVIENLSVGQINLLKAILKGEKRLSSQKNLMEYHLGTSANANKNRQTLINRDILNQTETGLELLDPVFEFWFRKMYFNEDFQF